MHKETILFTILQQNKFELKEQHIELSYFIFTDITEIVAVYLKLITFCCSQILNVYLIYHFFVFMIPALYKKEYVFIKFILETIGSIYFITLFLNNSFIIPMTWNFCLKFQVTTTNRLFSLYFEAKFVEYLTFYTLMQSTLVYYLQIFTLFFLLIVHVSTNKQTIKKNRKILYYIFLILLTFICISDVNVLILLWLCSIITYECLVLFFVLKKCR